LEPIEAVEFVDIFRRLLHPCVLGITYPSATSEFGATFQWILTQPEGAGCQALQETKPRNADSKTIAESVSPNTEPGIVLHSKQGFKAGEELARLRGFFILGEDGPILGLANSKGSVLTELRDGNIGVFDDQGFETSIGVKALVTPSTGETHKTSAASVVLSDKNKNVIWRSNLASASRGFSRVKLTHHGMEVELPDLWWKEAGMADFVCNSNAYSVSRDSTESEIVFVRINDVGPVHRSAGVGIFNDSPDEGSARTRVDRILRGFRLGDAIPPVRVVEGGLADPHQYKLVHGTHPARWWQLWSRSFSACATWSGTQRACVGVPFAAAADWDNTERDRNAQTLCHG
jgi:hypothetical protein